MSTSPQNVGYWLSLDDEAVAAAAEAARNGLFDPAAVDVDRLRRAASAAGLGGPAGSAAVPPPAASTGSVSPKVSPVLQSQSPPRTPPRSPVFGGRPPRTPDRKAVAGAPGAGTTGVRRTSSGSSERSASEELHTGIRRFAATGAEAAEAMDPLDAGTRSALLMHGVSVPAVDELSAGEVRLLGRLSGYLRACARMQEEHAHALRQIHDMRRVAERSDDAVSDASASAVASLRNEVADERRRAERYQAEMVAMRNGKEDDHVRLTELLDRERVERTRAENELDFAKVRLAEAEDEVRLMSEERETEAARATRQLAAVKESCDDRIRFEVGQASKVIENLTVENESLQRQLAAVRLELERDQRTILDLTDRLASEAVRRSLKDKRAMGSPSSPGSKRSPKRASPSARDGIKSSMQAAAQLELLQEHVQATMLLRGQVEELQAFIEDHTGLSFEEHERRRTAAQGKQ